MRHVEVCREARLWALWIGVVHAPGAQL